MIHIQEYDMEVRHIKGVQNNLADILSRNPRGMTDAQTRDLTRPDQVMFRHIQVYKDKNIKKELKALAELQGTAEKLASIKNRVTNCQPTDQTQFVLQDNVPYCKGEKSNQRYKAVLPSCLEHNIVKFVHFTLGHLGVDKCMEEIKYMFHVRNLGRKLRNL
jgi:hypothetical protein